MTLMMSQVCLSNGHLCLDLPVSLFSMWPTPAMLSLRHGDAGSFAVPSTTTGSALYQPPPSEALLGAATVCDVWSLRRSSCRPMIQLLHPVGQPVREAASAPCPQILASCAAEDLQAGRSRMGSLDSAQSEHMCMHAELLAMCGTSRVGIPSVSFSAAFGLSQM